ncbi:hypothetical protein [Vibrio sp. SCSIO 43137]|uniref:hypothetical protein n=1 Tax=Vibrio sp. SCSIO 43137 TaxID=3021011 RepID=UPI002306E500|nr:hypothetical protein [Vibrio sp. SCSIO 43137]WCE28420.1 hypothetical protein PK654_08515 [Vibrio sp. SCSIO 43137]
MSKNNLEALYPSSYLDAVNELLASIGEAPVNTIGEGLSESRLAQLTLDRASRNLQEKGWWFNTELLTISPNLRKELALPRNTLSIESMNGRYVYRDYKVYDREQSTFRFESDVQLKVVLALEWDFIPQTARTYIVRKACQMFQQQTVGSSQMNAELREEVHLAYVALQEEELEAVPVNLYDNAELMAGANMYRR